MRPSLTLVLVLVFSAALTATAQSPSGKIIFYREHHFSDGNYVPALFCDGVQLGRMLADSYQEVVAPAGKHNCAAEAEQRLAIPIDVPAGGAVYVLARITDSLERHGFLAIVMEEDYKRNTKLTPLAAPIRLDGSQQLELGAAASHAPEPLADESSPTANPASYPRCVYCPPPKVTSKDARSVKQAKVELKVTVGADGLPGNIEVVTGSGYPTLDQRAIDAVKTWRLAPAVDSDGKPVSTVTPVEVKFQILR